MPLHVVLDWNKDGSRGPSSCEPVPAGDRLSRLSLFLTIREAVEGHAHLTYLHYWFTWLDYIRQSKCYLVEEKLPESPVRGICRGAPARQEACTRQNIQFYSPSESFQADLEYGYSRSARDFDWISGASMRLRPSGLARCLSSYRSCASESAADLDHFRKAPVYRTAVNPGERSMLSSSFQDIPLVPEHEVPIIPPISAPGPG